MQYIYNYAENILKIKRNKNKNILKLKKLHYRKIFKNKDCFCFNKCMHLLIYKERKINFKNFWNLRNFKQQNIFLNEIIDKKIGRTIIQLT